MAFRFFDRSAAVEASRRHLPHWDQSDAYYFLTWRTADSIPLDVWEQWQQQRAGWLQAHGIDSAHEDWQRDVELLSDEERQEFYRRFAAQWHEMLDACHGECVLRRPELSKLVSENLQHLDGQAYVLEAFVVMPNHVHVLAGIPGRDAMMKRCRNWKRYTSGKINQALGREGQFWQWESFDHLVRGPSSLEKFRHTLPIIPPRHDSGAVSINCG